MHQSLRDALAKSCTAYAEYYIEGHHYLIAISRSQEHPGMYHAKFFEIHDNTCRLLVGEERRRVDLQIQELVAAQRKEQT